MSIGFARTDTTLPVSSRKPGPNALELAAANAHVRTNAQAQGPVLEEVARLDGADRVGRIHLAEALSYRALADEVRRAA
jgi:magnesium chelatase family protein